MLGDMPHKYWTQGTFEGAERISGAHMAETILTGNAACQGCVISCGRVVTVNEGPYATQGKVNGPEYETIASFGSQLLVDDLAIITALGNHCDARRDRLHQRGQHDCACLPAFRAGLHHGRRYRGHGAALGRRHALL